MFSSFALHRIFIYLLIYLLLLNRRTKGLRPLTRSVKAQEAKSTCNTQSTKHRETEKRNRNQALHIKSHEKKPSITHKKSYQKMI